MPAQKKEISLLPIDELAKSRFGKFLKWALSFGRWIVIFTELVVILCFLSRFKLDRDLTDLSEKIRRQQAIITSFGDLEKDFRNFQKRLSVIDQLEKEQLLASSLLDEISKILPFDVFLTNLAIQEKEIDISGLSLSEAGFGSFIRKLSELKFEKTVLKKVTKNKTGEIEFKLTTSLNDENG